MLRTDDELLAAVVRARAFERMRAERGGGRALTYERYLGGRPDGLAEVVQIDSSGSSGPERRKASRRTPIVTTLRGQHMPHPLPTVMSSGWQP
jgi:hypothetical protein